MMTCSSKDENDVIVNNEVVNQVQDNSLKPNSE